MVKGELVKEYLGKYPSTESSRIAAMIVHDAPGVFRDQEDARSMVRYYRGAHGERQRRDLDPASYSPRVIIPPSDHVDYSAYKINLYPIIVGGDAHIPYHDQDALEIFIEQAVKIGAKTVLLAGDWLDCYSLSRFVKDPRKRSIKEEFEIFKSVMQTIRKALPKAKIVYKIGNHEERYDAYLMNSAPALYGLNELHLVEALGLRELGIDAVSNKRVIEAGHLHIIHGHEYVFSIQNPVSPARGLYLRAKKSSLCFHFHQTSEHTEPDIDGHVVTCWSGGCLCDLHPEYMPLNKWNHGFAEVYDEGGDRFRVVNHRIVEYKVR